MHFPLQVKRHLTGLTPLMSLGIDLVFAPVIEPMHEIDGGVLKFFGEFFLNSGASKHSSPLAVKVGHRITSTDYKNLEYVLEVYCAMQIDDFPRKVRYLPSSFFCGIK